ncbi:hypothetical protein [Beijerinckia sp. L45]|uniref:hypothetical protein n=1 Tax=Beijerinckia sp. L45 TaxID=1641855 RepID=UPI00131CE5FB|nr:hypothetical protein [Beijerinckia sp. L45]
MNAKKEPTQGARGSLYDKADGALRYMACLQHACHGVRMVSDEDVSEDLDGPSQGISVVIADLRMMKAELHDPVEWAADLGRETSSAQS